MPAPKLPCFNYQAMTAGKEKEFGLTPAEIRPIWEYARKRYLDNGFSIEDTINALVKETGAPPRFFQEVMVGPKTMFRGKTREIFAREDARRQAKYHAQELIERADTSKLWKAIRTVGELPRAALTAFHGGVFPVTHGGGLLLVPGEWRTFARGAIVSWKSIDPAYYEKARLALETEDNYAAWRQAGLRIGVDERAQGVLSGWVASKPGWSNRAWLGLMRMRYEFAEQSLKNLKVTEAERPEVMKKLAEVANHATGVTNSALGRVLGGSKALFAPQLTASKLMRVTHDPAVTIRTAAKMLSGKSTTAGERAAMYVRTGHAAQMIGTWGAGLMLNAALLEYFGSQQKINWKDPRKSDWLRFKMGEGTVLSTRGPEEFLRLFGELIAIGHSSRRELHGRNPLDEAMDRIKQFALYKISPGISTVGELAYGRDIFGRPLPKSIQAVRHAATLGFLQKQEGRVGKPQYSNLEYASTHFPIFLTGPARDIYENLRDHGLDHPTAKMIMHAAFLTAGEFAGFGGYPEGVTKHPVPHKGQKPQLIP